MGSGEIMYYHSTDGGNTWQEVSSQVFVDTMHKTFGRNWEASFRIASRGHIIKLALKQWKVELPKKTTGTFRQRVELLRGPVEEGIE